MKTVEQIIQTQPVYLHLWDSRFGVITDFSCIGMTEDEYNNAASLTFSSSWVAENCKRIESAMKEHEGENILFASYGEDNYSGEAWVLFEKDGKLFEVNGRHCSCYGLEEQWEPEEVSLIELENRLINGTFGCDNWSGNNFKSELMAFLGLDQTS